MTRERKRDRPVDRFAEADHVEQLRRRRHEALADPTMDTPAKQLARQSAGVRVHCICGCGQDFDPEVRPA